MCDIINTELTMHNSVSNNIIIIMIHAVDNPPAQ